MTGSWPGTFIGSWRYSTICRRAHGRWSFFHRSAMAASFFGSWKFRRAGRKRSSPAARYSSRARGEIGLVPAMRCSFVPWVTYAVHEGVQFECAIDPDVDVDAHVCVRVV